MRGARARARARVRARARAGGADAALPRAVTHGGGDGGGGVRLCHVRALYMLVEERLEGGPLTRVAAACVRRAMAAPLRHALVGGDARRGPLASSLAGIPRRSTATTTTTTARPTRPAPATTARTRTTTAPPPRPTATATARAAAAAAPARARPRFAAAAARLTAPDALPPLLPALRELLEGPLAADGGGRFPRDAPLREYLQFAEPDLEDAPWFAASFPPALELRHALETYRFLVARAAPS